jgi:hypothetical protein
LASTIFFAKQPFLIEEAAKRHAAEMSLTLADIDNVLDAFCRAAEPHTLSPGWSPQLSDPDDEPYALPNSELS